jgi:CheY-like chemotaxis protein
LLAEDEDGIRRSVKRILELHGYTVLTAQDGVEALELVRREPDRFQLLISDVIMPRMGGRELHQALRREAPTLRMIFTSGYTALDVAETSDLDASVPFLHKPWTIADLLARVREVLDAPTSG